LYVCKNATYIKQIEYFSHSTDSKRDDSVDASQTEDTGGSDGGGSQS